ncbi:protein unc-50 [Cladochytrium replicatum]|nr:protein unc-50 [Cladochytrium replicatum]
MLPTSAGIAAGARYSSSTTSSPFPGSPSRRSRRRHSHASSSIGAFTTYFRRLSSFPQMDFEFALWQMLYLCISPRRVYRNIYYHKQTKNQWARDDPAFVVILSFFLMVAAVAYGVAYSQGFFGVLRLIAYMIFVDFVVVGLVVATCTWAFGNRFLIQHSLHSTEQSVEWAYAFDVHCNSFFPTFLLTYVLQFFFIPILTQDSWICLFFGNTLYLVAGCYYVYITFLGFSALPFLKNTTIFLYPIVVLGILYVISLFGFNISKTVLDIYF